MGTAGTVGEQAIWTYNIDERWDGTSRLAILLPGHGDGVSQFASNTTGGTVATALARTGKWVAVAIEAAGPVSWGNQAEVDAIEAARVAGVARGAFGPKCAVLGYSMRGLGAANYYKQHDDKLGALVTFSGVVDLDWAYGTGGHSPVASPDYHAEIDTAFGSYAATAGFRVWDEPETFQGGSVPWRLYHPTDDSTVPYALATAHVAAVDDPMVTLRSPDITGDHTGFWGNIPAGEIVTFLDAGDWS